MGPLKNELQKTQLAVAFDTAFHRTLPELAWRYPIERATAGRNKIRKHGFRGISQRYMTEEYARITSKHVDDVTVVTLHLESGSSAAALKNGKSIDIDGADAA